MNKRLIAFLSILSLFISLPAIPVNAAAKAGGACSKAGITAIAAGKTFTCVKSGKKFVWNKGVVAPVRKPIISPASSLLDPNLCKLQKPTNLQMDDGPEGSVGFPRNSESLVSLGNRKGLVLYVEFPDVKATSSLKSTWETC
jgi:hypothetical protein